MSGKNVKQRWAPATADSALLYLEQNKKPTANARKARTTQARPEDVKGSGGKRETTDSPQPDMDVADLTAVLSTGEDGASGSCGLGLPKTGVEEDGQAKGAGDVRKHALDVPSAQSPATSAGNQRGLDCHGSPEIEQGRGHRGPPLSNSPWSPVVAQASADGSPTLPQDQFSLAPELSIEGFPRPSHNDTDPGVDKLSIGQTLFHGRKHTSEDESQLTNFPEELNVSSIQIQSLLKRTISMSNGDAMTARKKSKMPVRRSDIDLTEQTPNADDQLNPLAVDGVHRLLDQKWLNTSTVVTILSVFAPPGVRVLDVKHLSDHDSSRLDRNPQNKNSSDPAPDNLTHVLVPMNYLDTR